MHLPTLQQILDERNGILGLPLIRNEKPVDPTRPESPRVYQLETAMGAAVSLFPEAEAVEVPRRRFAAVKTCADLLAVSSDAYRLTEDWRVELEAGRSAPPTIDLDPRYYRRFEDYAQRFPDGAPSLRACDALTVKGDVRFGAGVVVRGRARVVASASGQRVVPDGSVLEDDASVS